MSWLEAWQCAGRHVAGIGKRKEEVNWGMREERRGQKKSQLRRMERS